METNFLFLIESFTRWLINLGYAESTVYTSISFTGYFLTWLEKSGIKKLEQASGQTIKDYHKYLQERNNKNFGGGLSQNYITGNINALKRFARYLQETGKPPIEIDIKATVEKETHKTTLTTKEIRSLYHACENDIYGIRDRAILSIYYGCGLRRKEGTSLDVKDIQLKEKLVYVRKGKGHKERYVPMTGAVKEDLENYIHVARENFVNPKINNQEALFLSRQGKRIHVHSIALRLQKLAIAAGITKYFSLHALRHSIATHLLQSGMTLENVSKFLGHSSLESTQIYTHLANE
jgi:integrase/recombinase XerD